MKKHDVTTKLAATEASLKRWQTRLKRAATMVHELDRKRRRYQLEVLSAGQPVIATVKVRKQTETDHMPEETFATFAEAKEEESIPAFLNRADPLIAEKMTAARKKAEAAARKTMPLSGKAAEDYIKAPLKKRKG